MRSGTRGASLWSFKGSAARTAAIDLARAWRAHPSHACHACGWGDTGGNLRCAQRRERPDTTWRYGVAAFVNRKGAQDSLLKRSSRIRDSALSRLSTKAADPLMM